MVESGKTGCSSVTGSGAFMFIVKMQGLKQGNAYICTVSGKAGHVT
jgi:hypothetical protein